MSYNKNFAILTPVKLPQFKNDTPTHDNKIEFDKVINELFGDPDAAHIFVYNNRAIKLYVRKDYAERVTNIIKYWYDVIYNHIVFDTHIDINMCILQASYNTECVDQEKSVTTRCSIKYLELKPDMNKLFKDVITGYSDSYIGIDMVGSCVNTTMVNMEYINMIDTAAAQYVERVRD